MPRSCEQDFQELGLVILRHYQDASARGDIKAMHFWLVQFLALPALVLGKPSQRNPSHNLYKRRLQQLHQQLKQGSNNIAARLIVESQQGLQHGDSAVNAEDLRCVKRAVSFVRQGPGFLGKAAAALTQSPAHDSADPEVIRQLREMHPECKSQLPPLPVNSPKIIIPTRTYEDKQELRAMLAKLNRGSAGGPSGFTMSHLVSLSKHDDCLSGIATIMADICNGFDGKPCDEIREIITAANLIPLRKRGSNKPRPIAVGEVILRAATSYVSGLVMPAARAHCEPYQFGIGTPKGVQKVHIALQAKLDNPDHPTYAFLGDVKNAFNEIDRGHVMTEVFNDPKLQQANRLINFTYGRETKLLLNGNTTLSSRQGVRQGDGSGSWCYAVGAHPVYKKVADKHAGVDVLAITDDAAVVSNNIHHLVDSVTTMEEELKKIGLVMQWAKCKLLVPPTVQLPPEILDFFQQRGVEIASDATMHLGAPLGWSREKAQELLMQALEAECEIMFRRLKHPAMSRQEAYQILRVCTLPKLDYWTSVVRPEWLLPVAKRFDELVLDAATSKLALPKLTQQQLQQLRLKLRNGGLGLHSTVQLSPIAFTANIISTADLLSQPHILGELHTDTEFRGAVVSAISATRDQLDPESKAIKLLPPKDTYVDDNNTVINWLTTEAKGADTEGKKIQSFLSHEADTRRAEALLAAAGPTDAARLLAVKATHASAWLTATPADAATRMSNKVFGKSVRLRLGIPFSDHQVNGCACGQTWAHPEDDNFDPRHDLSCIKFKHLDVTHRHDVVKVIINKWIHRLGAASHLEYKYGPGKHRADIWVTFPSGEIFVLDVVITSATCPSAIKHRSHEVMLAAAAAAAKSKHAKYRRHLKDDDAKFVAIAAESDGGILDEAANFFKKVSKLAIDDRSCGYTYAEALRAMIAEVAVGIQRGNYRICRRALNNNIAHGHVVRQAQADALDEEEDCEFFGDDRDMASAQPEIRPAAQRQPSYPAPAAAADGHVDEDAKTEAEEAEDDDMGFNDSNQQPVLPRDDTDSVATTQPVMQDSESVASGRVSLSSNDDLVLPGPDSADEYIDSTPSSRQRRSRSRSRSRSRQMQLTSAETQAAADTLLNAMLQSPSLVNGLLEGGIELPLLSSSDTRNGTAAQPIQID